ncbi:hypothetical protein [Tengunoibacter tsumagoiensis]|uniref:Chondroitin AC/alginate lyase n=1 Tax=Tengunoibacter tsumagoiensis TaxID=2014871 RepID=A0A401ZTL0_9CHLR|nr:hypothetical protein [Tengunoibacter tsumagoiensis]GCE10201.1 hypothetical protein KTT_00600 [Tengunoibacter tsumagoiensis]
MYVVRGKYIFVVLYCLGSLIVGKFLVEITLLVYNPPQPIQITNESVLSTNSPSQTTLLAQQMPFNAQQVEFDLLNNIKQFGVNSDPHLNNGLGGLWVNWRYGSSPLQTNINGTGQTDGAEGISLRHDDLTDLRYLHNLWSYKHAYPHETTFDKELNRFTKIIRQEFTGTENERGWIYNVFMNLYTLSHDQFYLDTALNLIQGYAEHFQSQVGMIFKINAKHPHGTYRVDYAIEQACDLIEAGTQFHQSEWVAKGYSVLSFVYNHAYIARYNTFATQMEDVLNRDGSVNAHETFYVGYSNQYLVHGNHMQMGGMSQIIVSLLQAYAITQKNALLDKATSLLDQLISPTSGLQMWDQQNGGYFFSANFSGSTASEPGTLTVDRNRKEAGRQSIMLQTFHLANKFTRNKYKDMEQKMLLVALHHIYDPNVHGVHYMVRADWSPVKFTNGTPDTVSTSEAIGAELESLFSVQ